MAGTAASSASNPQPIAPESRSSDALPWSSAENSVGELLRLWAAPMRDYGESPSCQALPSAIQHRSSVVPEARPRGLRSDRQSRTASAQILAARRRATIGSRAVSGRCRLRPRRCRHRRSPSPTFSSLAICTARSTLSKGFFAHSPRLIPSRKTALIILRIVSMVRGAYPRSRRSLRNRSHEATEMRSNFCAPNIRRMCLSSRVRRSNTWEGRRSVLL